jgi:hypothetical protein
MDQNDMQRTLDEIIAMRQRADSRPYGDDWARIHALAEAHYEPARDFFLSGLTDSRAAWRELCLQCLGFHYIFPPDGEIAETIRQLLLNDPNDMVRIAAASVLGVRSKWPDPALKHALQVDRNKVVRQAAFAALLNLAKVPYTIVGKEEARVAAGEIRPSWREVQRVITDAGIKLEDPD